MCSRIINLFCSTTMDRASLFNHSIKDFSRLLKSSTSPVQCTSPFIVLQTCKRYTSFSARINNLNRPSLYTLNHQPIFAFSSLNQIKNLAQSFLHSTSKYQMARMMSQRSFSSQRGSHKRTGSHPSSSPWERANRTTMTYITALAVAVVGLSYAAVPLYRIFCQASGYGGTVSVVDPSEKVESMEPVRERELTIRWVVNLHTFVLDRPTVLIVLYTCTWKFSLDNNFVKSSHLCINLQEHLVEKSPSMQHISCIQILYTGQKIDVINICQ